MYKRQVLGSSIGGGLVEIHEINGKKVKITGEYPTIITCHDDVPGTVSKISTLFYENKINIARNESSKESMVFQRVDGCCESINYIFELAHEL